MAVPTLIDYLRQHLSSNDMMARAAANQGNHVEAIVRLARAEGFARAAYLYYTKRKDNTRYSGAEMQRFEANLHAQLELVRELLDHQGGSEGGKPGSVVVNNGHYMRVPHPSPQVDLTKLVEGRPSS